MMSYPRMEGPSKLPGETQAIGCPAMARQKRWSGFTSGAAFLSLQAVLRAIAALVGIDGRPVIVEAGTSSPDRAHLGWAPGLALNAAVALLLSAIAANASRTGFVGAVGLFYLSIALIYLPIAARAAYPDLSRPERVALVLIATAAFFLARMIRAPLGFIDHDEFLHWQTANDILEQGRLFKPNSLLPVSPLYPGLEIATTALAQLSGLSVFSSAMLLLATCRMAFMSALFLAFEKITASSRVAAIGCLTYMGSSTFLIFDSHFAYESLAVVFLVFVILSDLQARASPGRARRIVLALTVPLMAALAVTHHMTAFFSAALFVAVAVLEGIKTPAASFRARSFGVAGFAVAAPLIWSFTVGNPTQDYLGPVIRDGLREVTQIFTTQGRELFVADDGSVAPAWQRAVAIGSVAIISAGLATGFVRALAYAGFSNRWQIVLSLRMLRGWKNSWLVVLTVLTLAYPLSILFRLTRSGWEIGNRIGPFSFLGVSLVLAIGVASLWDAGSKSVVRYVLVATAATVIVIGGIISAEGPRVLVPAQFQVSGDAASVEPMAISTASWTRRWLGASNRFASDRINRLLLATYGRQRVATTLQDARDAGVAIQSPELRPSDRALLRQLGIDYVLTDLRLTTALPVVGVYFDGGAADRNHSTPLAAKALLKFNNERSVGRPFDNGYQIIFDVRNLDARN